MKTAIASRDRWVDYAKAIGIILVVYGHIARGVFNAGLKIDNDIFQLSDSVIYSFHMPLFFFLSGIFFQSSFEKRSTKDFLLGKVNTILYPYVVWSVVQGTVEVIMSRYTNNHESMTDVLSFVWAPRAQFWFLYVLFFVFVLAALIYRRPSSSAWRAGIFAGAVGFYLVDYSLSDLYLIDVLKHNFVYFSLGSLVIFTVGKFNTRVTTTLLLMSVIFLFSQWYFHVGLGLRYNNDTTAFALLLAFIGIGMVIALSQWLSQFDLPWLSYLGRHSMTIYLVHIIAGSGCRIVLQRIFGVSDVGMHLFIGTLGGLLLPLMFYWFCTRAKLNFLFSPPERIWRL